MAIVQQFSYTRPKSVDEALAALAESGNGSGTVCLLAGGTDLVDMIKAGAARPDLVVDLKGIDGLKTLSFERGTLSIGAAVTFSDLIESADVRKHFPVIVELAKTVASPGIRNRATVVGNICSAVPCMDSGPLLVAYDGVVHTAGPKGARTIPAKEWFVGPRRTALHQGEFVTGISLPLPAQPHAGCWIKLGRYAGEDLAQVSVLALALKDGTFRVAYGAVAPVPVRAANAEHCINGQAVTPALFEHAGKCLEHDIAPISDLRSSREYRMHMAKVMLRRAAEAALARLHGRGPAYGTTLI